MNGRSIALASVALVAVAAVLGTWRWAAAVGPDVDNDGLVSVGDIGQTVQAFGQQIPLAHKLYALPEDVTLDPEAQGDQFTSSYLDARGCTMYTARARGSGQFEMRLIFSMDGVTDDAIAGATAGPTAFWTVGPGSIAGFPFVKVRVVNPQASGQSMLTDLFLYCTP